MLREVEVCADGSLGEKEAWRRCQPLLHLAFLKRDQGVRCRRLVLGDKKLMSARSKG